MSYSCTRCGFSSSDAGRVLRDHGCGSGPFDKYQKIRTCGLTPLGIRYNLLGTQGSGGVSYNEATVVYADELLKWLEAAPVVKAMSDKGEWRFSWPDRGDGNDDCTHSARLVCVEATPGSTAIELLRAFYDHVTRNAFASPSDELMDRTRRLLGPLNE